MYDYHLCDKSSLTVHYDVFTIGEGFEFRRKIYVFTW